MTLLALFFATFASEDVACLTAGTLASSGRAPLAAAVVACAAGIYVGDLGLWIAGRLLGARVLAWRRLRSALPIGSPGRAQEWLEANASTAILASRFVPGTRLPLYVGAGALGMSFATFARWTAVAVGLWAPVLVIAAAVFDRQLVTRAGGSIELTGLASVTLLAATLAGARYAVRRIDHHSRQRLAAHIGRIWRWEFWPMWLFYAPVALWTLILAVRHGGLRTITAANPAIPDGGVVGESKFDILRRLPQEWTIPSALIPPADRLMRVMLLHQCIVNREWQFPIVLKPDAGERGSGVRLVRTLQEAEAYLDRMTGPVLAQPYHPGPFEAGVFYYRMPGALRGQVLAITDKHFPSVLGDGRSTIEDLVWAHPRYRMQARTFLSRLGTRMSEVPAAGMAVQLGMAGNHAQGAMFTDGAWMITPALEARIDDIARACPGFFVGRFDARYKNRRDFLAGQDLAIVELNGATAECTNIYDPARSLLSAYRTLFRQWQLVFAIGAANRQSGQPMTSRLRMLALLRAHLQSSPVFPISD